MRRVNNFELIEAKDPQGMTVLLNVASDRIADRGGTLMASHIPDILSWQALNERHPLFAMLEYALPEIEGERVTTENPPLPPLISQAPLRVVPFVGRSGNGE